MHPSRRDSWYLSLVLQQLLLLCMTTNLYHPEMALWHFAEKSGMISLSAARLRMAELRMYLLGMSTAQVRTIF